MKYISTFLWLSAALLSAAPADKTLNLSIYDTTSTSFLNRAFTVSGNNGKVLGISGGDWALVTASGSSSLTSTQIAYGDGSNVQTSEAAFAYNSTLNILSVDAIRLAAAGVGLSTNGDGALVIDGLGNGFDESIKMDFDTTSNVVQTSSPLTGVTIMDYLDMSLRVTDSGGNFATLGPSGITVHNSAWAGNYTLDFGGTDGANEEVASKEWVNAQSFRSGTFGVTVDGGGSVLTSGNKGIVIIPFACTITGWSIVADQSGSVTFGVEKASDGVIPSASIVASAAPALTATQITRSTTLTGWTTSVTANDVIEFTVTGTPSSITRATLQIHYTK